MDEASGEFIESCPYYTSIDFEKNTFGHWVFPCFRCATKIPLRDRKCEIYKDYLGVISMACPSCGHDNFLVGFKLKSYWPFTENGEDENQGMDE